MTMPFYVSPEQLMKDRADYARKGIGRGRSVAVVQYVDGILFVSENPSQALHKISEIYDRIGFAAVGRYNEFENLRIAGVRLADLRGYSYDRRDVTGRGLANAYAQTLGSIFSSGGEKPYEVELFVAELGDSTATDQVFRLTYDGQVADERGFAAMGGQADSVTTFLSERWRDGLSLTEALRLAVGALGHGETGEDRTIPPADLEVAVLDRTRTQQRKFRRIGDALLAGMLDGPAPEPPTDGDGGGDGGGSGEPDGTNEPDRTGESEDTVVPVMPLVDGETSPEELAGDEPDVDAESAVEEAPADQPPVEEAPAEEAPAEEPLADEPPTEGEADDDGSTDEILLDQDPREVASAESPLTELDVEAEPVQEASSDEPAPAEDEPSPAWSEEEWPPVAPPLVEDVAPTPGPDTDADASQGPAGDVGAEEPEPEPEPEPENLWPLAEDTGSIPEIHDEPGEESADASVDELSEGSVDSGDRPAPSIEPPGPRADRPPPPPFGGASDEAEVTEDLEQEWTEPDPETPTSPEAGRDDQPADDPRGFFDLYGTGPEASEQSTPSDDADHGDGDHPGDDRDADGDPGDDGNPGDGDGEQSPDERRY